MTDFLDDVVERFGDDILVEDKEIVSAISTGSLSLDASIGIGGVPVGRITEIYGAEGSGKTTLAVSISRNAVKNGINVLYVDAENMLDYNIVEKILGETLDRNLFTIIHPDSAEDNLSACEIAIDSKKFGLVILDSVGALAPQKEKDDEFTDTNVALVPRLMSKFLRRTAFSIRKNKVALVIINQIRDTIGSYVPMQATPGGHALKHFTSLRIALSKGQDIKVGEETVGINVKFVVKKNKMSAPFRSFIIPLFFGIGIDTYRDLVLFSEMLGVLKKRGAYYIFQEENIGQGVTKTITYLKENPKTLDEITKMVYNILNKDSKISVEPPEEVKEEEKDEKKS